MPWGPCSLPRGSPGCGPSANWRPPGPRPFSGAAVADRTRVGGVRHGVLAVTVAHPALLEELSAFRKPELLAALREKVPGLNLLDIRFRVGPVEPHPDRPPTTPKQAPKPKPKRPKRGD